MQHDLMVLSRVHLETMGSLLPSCEAGHKSNNAPLILLFSLMFNNLWPPAPQTT